MFSSFPCENFTLIFMPLIPLSEGYWRHSTTAYLRAWVGMSIPEMQKSDAAYEAIREFACNVLVHLAVSNGIKKFSPNQIVGTKMRPGISIHIDDGEALRHIRFGIYMNEWTVESYLPCAESLPFVPDAFWRDLADLASIGKAEVFDNCPVHTPTGTPKKFMDTKKSVTFRLIRNLIFRKLTEPKSGDVGSLITSLPIETPYLELMDNLRRAFGLYHRCVGRLVKDAKRTRRGI